MSMYSIRLYAFLLCFSFSFLWQNAEAQKTSLMTFTSVKGAGAQKNWTADTCFAHIDKDANKANIVTVTGMFPTGRTDIPYQMLVLQIRDFKGPDTYTINLSNSYFQDLFGSSSLKKSPALSGTVTIVAYDKTTLKLGGNFEMRVQSTPNVGDPYVTQIINGVFVAIVENQLFITARPSEIDTMKAKPSEKVSYTLVVRDKEDTAIPDAQITLTTNMLGVTDSTVDGVTDANGQLTCTIKIPDKTQKGPYSIYFRAKKTPFVTSDSVKRVISVDTSQRYYYYRCAGMPLFAFDAGEGKIWEDIKNGRIEATGNTITLNDFVRFDGDMIIDTTKNRERMLGDGRFFVPNASLPGGGSGDFVLWDGPFTFGLGCFGATRVANAVNKKVSQLIGLDFKLDTFAIVGDKGALGVQIAATIRFESKIQKSCEDTASTKNDTSSFNINFTVRSTGIENFQMGVKNIGMGPQQCIQELSFLYNTPRDTANIKGKYKNPTMTIGMNVAFKSGLLNGGGFEYTPGDCIPLGESDLCIKTVTGGIRGFAAKPFIIDIGATIVPLQKALERLLEIGFTGQYLHPGIITLTGTLKEINTKELSATRPWQEETTITGKFDLFNGITVTGGTKLGHFGGSFSFVEGTQSVGIQWNPSLAIVSSIKGQMNIPDIGDSLKKKFPFNLFSKFINVFPTQLGAIEAMQKNLKITGNVDFTTCPVEDIRSLGKGYAILDFDKFGSVDFLTMGSGYVPLKGIKPDRKGNDIQTIDEGRQSAAKALDSISVDATMDRVFIIVTSLSVVPPTSITAPDGKIYTSTATDSSVIFALSRDKQMGFWTLVHPQTGTWKITMTNPASTDSIEVESLQKQKSFSVTATTSNRTLNVVWDGTSETSGSTVDILLDKDDNGYDGYWLGTADATTGKFSTVLNDSLVECEYHVVAVKTSDKGMSRTYAPGTVSTGKAVLAPPTNIVSSSNQFGVTSITWNVSPDPSAAGYSLWVRDAAGVDSLYATLFMNETSVTLNISNPMTKKIWMQSFNSNGLRGCPGSAQAITVGVDDATSVSTSNPLVVIPNPTSGQSMIKYLSESTGSSDVEVTNLLGQVVIRIPSVNIREGVNEWLLPTDQLSSGFYRVRLHHHGTCASSMISVLR